MTFLDREPRANYTGEGETKMSLKRLLRRCEHKGCWNRGGIEQTITAGDKEFASRICTDHATRTLEALAYAAGSDDHCESCGHEADVRLPDGSTWCAACDGIARRLGYDDATTAP